MTVSDTAFEIRAMDGSVRRFGCWELTLYDPLLGTRLLLLLLPRLRLLLV